MTADPVLVELARKHGLPDAAALQGAVTQAYGAARFGFLSPAGTPVSFDPHGAQRRRAQELLRTLSALRALLPPNNESDDLFSPEMQTRRTCSRLLALSLPDAVTRGMGRGLPPRRRAHAAVRGPT